MKALIKISALVIGFTLTAAMQSHGQELPMACAGSISRYGVNGLAGSTFTWTITDPSGHVIPYTPITSDEQTIEVQWSDTYTGGVYTFSVEETSIYGCTGAPWDQQFVILNTPTINIPFEGVPSSVAVCYGETATLDPGVYKNYFWQDGSTNQIYYTGEAGTYQVRLVDNGSSCSYNNIEAVIHPLPVVWLGNDTVLFGNQTLTLDAYNPNFQIYNWSDGSTLTSTTVTGQAGNQTIWVKVTDDNGCKNSDTINISAADYNHLRIPAAFTPNGDGINDKWYFPAPDPKLKQDLFPYFDNVEVRIFNRWGKLVWQSNKQFSAWDGKDLNGKELPMDSYHYIIRFIVNDKTYLYKGSVTIIR